MPFHHHHLLGSDSSSSSSIASATASATSSASSSGSSSVCPTEAYSESLTIVGDAHHAMYIAAGVCAIITVVVSVSLILTHLTRYRAPKEQRQIIRLVFTPVAFAVVSWAEIASYPVAPYIDVIGEVYEAFAITGIYLLLIQFAVPSGTFSESMFDAMYQAAEKADTKGSNWPKLSWLVVFQYPITEIIAAVILEGTLATGYYCQASLSPKYGHFWYEVIKSVGLGACVIAILRFHGRMKGLMKTHRAMWKLVCFKIIVFLRFIQSWVFNILIDKNVIHESSTFSYGDFYYGVPNVLLAAEMVLISISMWYAYTPGEYSENARPRDKPLNFFHAIVDALNPTDLLLGIVRAFTLIGSVFGKSSKSQPQYGPVGGGFGGGGLRQPVAQDPYAYPDARDKMYDSPSPNEGPRY